MRAALILSLACALLIVPAAGFAETAKGKSAMQPFSAPMVLRGTLGERQIQMQLRPKAGEEGIEGEYFAFGNSTKILLAGESDGGELVMEESENGTDVSGHWLGMVSGDAIRGDWESLDGSVKQAFQLQIVHADDGKPARRTAAEARAGKRH